MEAKEIERLARRIVEGDMLSVSRALTLVENDEKEGLKLISKLVQSTGNSFVVGITGPPGVGKSTLINRLIEEYRNLNVKVGVLAIDPSSPLTGGAFLGDRIRMVDHTSDKGVYIRSMASRGWQGGLSASAAKAVCVLDSAGIDVILIETAGAGQNDFEVSSVSNVVAVVLMPNSGDVIQLSKAGLLEVGDIFVVNKSDIEGTNYFVSSILSILGASSVKKPVFSVSSLSGKGIRELFNELETRRKKFLMQGRENVKIRNLAAVLKSVAKKRIMERFEAKVNSGKVEELARMAAEGKVSLEQALERLSS